MKLYIMVGFPASGKSEYAQHIEADAILSRDEHGGNVIDLMPDLLYLMQQQKVVILDNMNLTKKQRRPFIETGKQKNYTVIVVYMSSNIEDCQIRYLQRNIKKYGHIVFDGHSQILKDPSIYPPVVFFSARKRFEMPLIDEGFDELITIKPKIKWPQYSKKCILFDIDGTLRQTDHLPHRYPTQASEVQLITDQQKMLQKIEYYKSQGYMFAGISNQSGIAFGRVSQTQVAECMDKTKELLNLQEMPINICKHKPNPIQCYCRKPQVGLVVDLIYKLKLNPKKCIIVGDRTTDKTLAQRLQIQFVNSKQFWDIQ